MTELKPNPYAHFSVFKCKKCNNTGEIIVTFLDGVSDYKIIFCSCVKGKEKEREQRKIFEDYYPI